MADCRDTKALTLPIARGCPAGRPSRRALLDLGPELATNVSSESRNRVSTRCLNCIGGRR